MRANRKRYNHAYILSPKHTYRPMRARVVAQLFDKIQDCVTEWLLKNCFSSQMKALNLLTNIHKFILIFVLRMWRCINTKALCG